MPKFDTQKQLSPNNYTKLKFTLLSGKLDFNLVTKETKYIDLSFMSEFNEKEFKKQKEIEQFSYSFKYLVYHNKKEKSIKLLNFEENLINTNKELMEDYNLVS